MSDPELEAYRSRLRKLGLVSWRDIPEIAAMVRHPQPDGDQPVEQRQDSEEGNGL